MNYTTKQAWAIALADGYFVGAYWFGTCPDYMKGSRTCLWETRKQAREANRNVKGRAVDGKFPEARVVRVKVRIGEVLS